MSEVQVPCQDCAGRGENPVAATEEEDGRMERCPTCASTGEVTAQQPATSPGEIIQLTLVSEGDDLIIPDAYVQHRDIIAQVFNVHRVFTESEWAAEQEKTL